MAPLSPLWSAWIGGDTAQEMGTPAGAWSTFLGIYAWFLGLQLLDLGSTMMVLAHGGVEANRLGPAQAVAQDGASALLGFKLAAMVVTLVAWMPVVAWLNGRPEGERRFAVPVVQAMFLAATLVYTAVVFHNLSNLRLLLMAG